MFGIVLASHGKFSEGLMDSVKMIMGPQKDVEALALEPQDEPADLKQRIYEAYNRVNKGEGALVLVDMMGGSPGNAAAYLASDGIPVITGVNLPMLLEIMGMRGMALEDVVGHIIDVGRDGIDDLRKIFRGV